jgi:N-acetylglutamate synthase-like GNAT family acetyltransferase
MEFSFRNFQRKDLGACVKIISDTMGKGRARRAGADLLAKLGPGEKGYSFVKRKVVTLKGKVIALVCVYRLNAHPKNVMGIDWFAVDRKYWRKGLGTRLVRWAMAQAKASKKNTVFVWSTKKSIPFYEKLGFARSGMDIVRESRTSVLLVKRLD